VVLVEHLARFHDVDGGLRLVLPWQVHQPLEVRADHAVLAGAVGHALQALQFLARLLLDFLGHAGLADALLELLELRGRAAFVFAQLLLDRAHLLAQEVLAVGLVDGLARLLVHFLRDLEDFDAMREEVEEPVQARLQVERLEEGLLLLGAHVHHPGDEIGERGCALDAFERRHHLLRHLRQQRQDFHRAFAQRAGAALDLRFARADLVDHLHARGHEGIALEPLHHAETLVALHDGVMRALAREVAQDVGAGADPVQLVGLRILRVGLRLQQDAQRALQAHGFLRRGARALAPDRQRHHDAGEQHHAAHRKDDQCVFGESAICHFCNLKTRQPLASSCEMDFHSPRGNETRRSK
jgi:hypothetical protein